MNLATGVRGVVDVHSIIPVLATQQKSTYSCLQTRNEEAYHTSPLFFVFYTCLCEAMGQRRKKDEFAMFVDITQQQSTLTKFDIWRASRYFRTENACVRCYH